MSIGRSVDEQLAAARRALVEDHQAVRHELPNDVTISPSHYPDDVPNMVSRPDWATSRGWSGGG
jgi:hypothetical protein